MRNGNPCPKCGQTEIVRVPSVKSAYGVGNLLWLSYWSTVPVSHYLCLGCGFLEQWVDARQDAERARQRFGVLRPAPPAPDAPPEPHPRQ